MQFILDRKVLNWLSKNQLTLALALALALALERLNQKYSQPSIRRKVNININQWQLKVESGNLLTARKNVYDEAGIGFNFHFRFPLSKLNWKLLQ